MREWWEVAAANAIYYAYKCEDCKNVRYSTLIPSVTNGVAENLTTDDLPKIIGDCITCKGEIKILYATKDEEESSAYNAAIEAVESEKK